MTNDAKRTLGNFILFECAWFLNVLMPGQLSAAITLVILAIHLTFISARVGREVRFIFMVASLGIGVDILLQNTGVLVFPDYEGPYAEGMIPVWLVAIWLMFATTVNHCLYWMRNHPVGTLIASPIGGAFAYFGAARLGALEIGHGLWGIAAIALAWLILFPLFIQISRWLESAEDPSHASPRW